MYVEVNTTVNEFLKDLADFYSLIVCILRQVLDLLHVRVNIEIKGCCNVGMTEQYTYCLVVTVAFNAACCKAVAQSVVFQSRYVETLHKSMIIAAVGAWLCHNAESQQPFDEIRHRHTLNEVGDVSEGKYDWKIVKEQGIGGFSI